jgi:hypothetical protein
MTLTLRFLATQQRQLVTVVEQQNQMELRRFLQV